MAKEFEPVPAFKPAECRNCKGHANHMLDCEYTEKVDRELLVKVLDNYIPKE